MDAPAAILVTGASRGLGRGVAEALAPSGFSVAIHYARDEAAARDTAASCERTAIRPDQRFPLIRGDIAQTADRRMIVDRTLDTLGRIDALVNNAGMAPRVRADILEATEESFDEVLGVNLKGPYFLTQLVARHWLSRLNDSRLSGGYQLIFITSISADTASLQRGDYCISKAGLSMASRLWAARLAEHGINVIELRPGVMATDMTAGVRAKYDALIAEGLVPQRRWGTPRDVGLAVRAIIEGRFPFTTGDVIHLDGGFHLRRL